MLKIGNNVDNLIMIKKNYNFLNKRKLQTSWMCYKNLFFFFKFFKFTLKWRTSQNKWRHIFPNLIKKNNIYILKQFLTKLKKNRYKPYSIFKFQILKYRRLFNPKYVLFLNNYLLTKYNYLSLQHVYIKTFKTIKNKILNINSLLTGYNWRVNLLSPYTMSKSVYLFKQNNYNWLKKQVKRFYKTKSQSKHGLIGILKLKKFITISTKPIIVPALNESFDETYYLWKKYQIVNSFKKLNHTSIRYNTTITNSLKNFQVNFKKRQPTDTYNTIDLTLSNSYANTMDDFNKVTYSNLKILNNLTNYVYIKKEHKFNIEVKLVTLKILFNTYNYKTYNWRIIN